jgi:hypothetical protein
MALGTSNQVNLILIGGKEIMNTGIAIVIAAVILSVAWAVVERHRVVAANVAGERIRGDVYVVDTWTGKITMCYRADCVATEQK